MKGREDNTDDRNGQGQHKRQAQMDRQGQNRQKCPYSTSHTARHLKIPHLNRHSVS